MNTIPRISFAVLILVLSAVIPSVAQVGLKAGDGKHFIANGRSIQSVVMTASIVFGL